MLWLLGKCAHGANCYYAHDTTYLDRGGWWNDADKMSRLSRESELEITGNRSADKGHPWGTGSCAGLAHRRVDVRPVQ